MKNIPRLSAIFTHLLQQPNLVVEVNIAVGELTLFSENEIQETWSSLVNDTSLSKIKLTIKFISAEQQCMVCFQKYKPLKKETSCPYCGSVGAKILAGEEFYLESFEEENE